MWIDNNNGKAFRENRGDVGGGEMSNDSNQETGPAKSSVIQFHCTYTAFTILKTYVESNGIKDYYLQTAINFIYRDKIATTFRLCYSSTLLLAFTKNARDPSKEVYAL